MSIEGITIINTSSPTEHADVRIESRAAAHVPLAANGRTPATSAPGLNTQLLSSWLQSSSFFSVCEFHESTASAESVSA